ncbi:hypothetical protein [Actinokineospora enzanensis]|uniref:hypothetical protein n=1 Tax=Actinokineospora enzanensis TaxID=155975 RepID=UPI00037D5A02|nr:hypothetical protein [Actinokineospora enzanensis]
MTQNDMVKSRIRARQRVTEETYSRARTVLLRDYPMPTREELAAADAVAWDPLLASMGSTPPPSLARLIMDHSGPGPDSYNVRIPDRLGPAPGPDWVLALVAHGDYYEDLPALSLECVGIVEGREGGPRSWATSLGVELAERGWEYSVEGSRRTLGWRIELTPGAEPVDPVHARVHDGGDFVLFDGPFLASPSWLVRTTINPVGLLAVAGPVSGSLFPVELDDQLVDDMLGTADLIAARIPVIRVEPPLG